MTMNEDLTVAATVSLKQRTLTVAASGGGYVDSSPAGIDCGSAGHAAGT